MVEIKNKFAIGCLIQWYEKSLRNNLMRDTWLEMKRRYNNEN